MPAVSEAAHYVLVWIGFFFVSVASSQLAVVFPKVKLPLITGYLAIGILAGRFVLDFVQEDWINILSPVNQFVLAFVGFSAGAELYLPELRELFKSIIISVITISVATFVLVTAIVRVLLLYANTLAPWVTSSSYSLSPACITGVSMIIAAIMTARSPASCIAVVKELRAKGPFTRSFLGITVISDVVVLVLFAIAAAYTRGQCDGKGFPPESILTLLASLVFSFLFGYFILGKLVIFLLWVRSNDRVTVKWLILPIGFALFQLSTVVQNITLQKIGHELSPEPLLITIVAGYVATNQSRNRRKFLAMLQRVGPYIFIPFFTLTGASLNLNVMAGALGLACIIFLLRAFSIFVGSTVGGFLSKSPTSHIIWMWPTLLTQAGVSLGLAGELNVLFPTWGPSCSTCIVAVIVLNQLFGPIFCKFAIKRVGEDGKAKIVEDTGNAGRRALIIGINAYSLCLASRLRKDHWRVIAAEFDGTLFSHTNALNQKQLVSVDYPPTNPATTTTTSTGSNSNNTSPHDQTMDTKSKSKSDKKFYEMDVEGGEKTGEVEDTDPFYDIENRLIPSKEGAVMLENKDKWDYSGLAKDMKPRTDVVIIMLDSDEDSLNAAHYFKAEMRFRRIIVGVNNPTNAETYASIGIVPFFTFSASVYQLYACVTTDSIDANTMVRAIESEAEDYPNNMTLLTAHQHVAKFEPRPDIALISLDDDIPLQTEMMNERPMVASPSNPLAASRQSKIPDMFRELKDPGALLEKSGKKIPVVPDEEHGEYLNSLAALHNPTPLATNTMWYDLFGSGTEGAQSPIQTRASDTHQNGVFEQYHR